MDQQFTARRPTGALPECHSGTGGPGSDEERITKARTHYDVRILLGGEKVSLAGRRGGTFHRFRERRKALVARRPTRTYPEPHIRAGAGILEGRRAPKTPMAGDRKARPIEGTGARWDPRCEEGTGTIRRRTMIGRPCLPQGQGQEASATTSPALPLL